MTKIRVFLSDDHTIFREGLRALLAAADDMEVVGEAENGHETLNKVAELQPDVVLMDIAMPLLDGLEAMRQITRRKCSTRVIVLSAYDDDHFLDQAILAGAAGYVTKGTTENHLFDAIREVHQGRQFYSRSVTRRLVQRWEDLFVNGRAKKIAAKMLTSRQTETLQLVAEGYSTKEIASLLSISIKTVEKHRQTIMDKLNIHDVASLTRYAISRGVVSFNL